MAAETYGAQLLGYWDVFRKQKISDLGFQIRDLEVLVAGAGFEPTTSGL